MNEPFVYDPVNDRYTLDSDRVKFSSVYTEGNQRYGGWQRAEEYDVYVDGLKVTAARKVRYSGWLSNRTNSTAYRRGHWGWEADGAPETDYPTRADAVAEAIRAVHNASEGSQR